jgi:hypothetical protein
MEQPAYQQYPQSYSQQSYGQQPNYSQPVHAMPWVDATPVRTRGEDEVAVSVRSVKMTWGDMFAFQFKWWVVGTVYAIAGFILWMIFFVAIMN